MTIGGNKLAIALVINQFTLREKCPYWELFRSAFSRIRIESKCGKMQTRTTPNMETFYAMLIDKLVVTLLTNYFLPYVQFQQIFYWFFIFCCRFTRQIPVRKISKFEELVKYFPYCTLHRTTTTIYFMKSFI